MEDNWQYMTPDMKLEQIRNLICQKTSNSNRLCECNDWTNWNIFKDVDLDKKTPVSLLVK